MADRPISDQRRSQNRKAQRNHRNNVKKKISSLEDTNSRLLDLLLHARKSGLRPELTGTSHLPGQAREETERYDKDLFEGQSPDGVRDPTQLLEFSDDPSQATRQEQHLLMNLPQTTMSPPKIATEMRGHVADNSKNLPPMSPSSLESPWALFEDEIDRDILSPQLEISPGRLSQPHQDAFHAMSTELMTVDMFSQDDDSAASQRQSNNSGNEEFSSGTRPRESTLLNGNRGPPLFMAIANSHLEVATFLITHGADPNSRDEHDRTPLHVCAECADAAMTGLLLEHGALLETKDKNGMTPLQLAASNGALGVVEKLVSYGARVNL